MNKYIVKQTYRETYHTMWVSQGQYFIFGALYPSTPDPISRTPGLMNKHIVKHTVSDINREKVESHNTGTGNKETTGCKRRRGARRGKEPRVGVAQPSSVYRQCVLEFMLGSNEFRQD